MAEKRHFMAIGGGPIGHPAIPNFQLPNRQLLNAPIRQSSGSFVLTHPAIKKESPKKFPDIFTTCPELRNFKMPIANFQKQLSPSIPLSEPSEPFPESPVQGSFDPNANCINPIELHFIPREKWTSDLHSLRYLCDNFFKKRNGTDRLFPVKLYHALLITKAFPDAYQYTGVKWVSNDVFKVNGNVFAKLLGITQTNGGLFHKQGNLPRHKFMQVYRQNRPELAKNPDIKDVDDISILLFYDSENRFSMTKEYDNSIS